MYRLQAFCIATAAVSEVQTLCFVSFLHEGVASSSGKLNDGSTTFTL